MQENVIKIFENSFREHREMSALTDYFKGETFSYYELAKEIAKLHLLFKEAGIKQGDKIALIGRNNPRWCITWLATVTYGAVIVPILQDFAPTDIIHIINHSESRLLFLGDNYWDSIEPDQIEKIEGVFSLTDFHAIYERKGEKLTNFQKDIKKAYRKAYPRGFNVEDIKYVEVEDDQLMLLNYTSGTTGYSKGVMLTCENITGNVLMAFEATNPDNGEFYFQKGFRILSFLPLAHAFGCAFDFLASMARGMHVTLLGKMPTPKILIEAMANVRPNVILAVPLILDKIYRKQILPMLEKTAGFSEATLTGANVLMETETGNFIRACPCCGKFETLVNDWCDPETCPDADCDQCEEAAVRIRCKECGYRSPMYHTTVEEAEEYWNTVAGSLDDIDERSL